MAGIGWKGERKEKKIKIVTHLQFYVSCLDCFKFPFCNSTVMTELVCWRYDCSLETRRDERKRIVFTGNVWTGTVIAGT